MTQKAANEKLAQGLMTESAIDFQKGLSMKLKSILERKLGALTESDRNVGLEVEIAAKSFGGDPTGTVNGVVAVEFRNHQAALHYADWLEEQATVEYYEISAQFKDLMSSQKVDATEIDFDAIMDDGPYVFTVLAYLYPEYVQFTHDYDQDGDVDAGDAAAEISSESELAQYDIEDLEAVLENEQLDELTKELLGRYIKKASQHRVRLAHAERDLDDKDSAIQKAKHGSDNDTYDALSKAQDATRKQYHKVVDKGQQRAQGIATAVKKLTRESVELFESLNEDQLDEVMRKIRVNARGLKSIKMQCPSGFKWDPSLEACMKITGAELSTMRRASRHALITKRNEGQALKVRVKRRIKRAFKFRQMMGMKI